MLKQWAVSQLYAEAGARGLDLQRLDTYIADMEDLLGNVVTDMLNRAKAPSASFASATGPAAQAIDYVVNGLSVRDMQVLHQELAEDNVLDQEDLNEMQARGPPRTLQQIQQGAREEEYHLRNMPHNQERAKRLREDPAIRDVIEHAERTEDE